MWASFGFGLVNWLFAFPAVWVSNCLFQVNTYVLMISDHRYFRSAKPSLVHIPKHGLDSARCGSLLLDPGWKLCKGAVDRAIYLYVCW